MMEKKIKLHIQTQMNLNSSFYVATSNYVLQRINLERFNIPKGELPFNTFFVHKSPINVLGPIGKRLCKTCPIDVNNAFLSNSYTKYPFHTTFSSFNIEADAKRKLKLVRRYGGVSEASVVGPTNVKNPKVKLGMLKFEYNIDSNGYLNLRNWFDTEK